MYVLPSYRKFSKNKNLSPCVYKGQRVIFWATTLYRDETYRDCVINSQKNLIGCTYIPRYKSNFGSITKNQHCDVISRHQYPKKKNVVACDRRL